MPKIAVCLSGCGVYDGSEIHEAAFTLLALDQARAEILCCAPNVPQAAVVNHLTREPMPHEVRNVLVESARIARGQILDIAGLRATAIHGLIFPGGFGAAKNLCDFADRGLACTVHPEVQRLACECLDAGKPIGAICIAPALLARILGQRSLRGRLTIGSDPATAEAISKMGAEHVACSASGIVVDEKYRLVTTPAYMLGKGPAEVYDGIRRLVGEVLRMAR